MKRLLGKKFLPGIENSRKANIKILNSFKLQGNNEERKKMQAELLLQNRFKKLGQAFIDSSSRKDAKGKVATKKCRS